MDVSAARRVLEHDGFRSKESKPFTQNRHFFRSVWFLRTTETTKRLRLATLVFTGEMWALDI